LTYLFYTDGRFIGPTSGHVSDGVAATSEDHKRDVEPFDVFYTCPMTLDALKKYIDVKKIKASILFFIIFTFLMIFYFRLQNIETSKLMQ
jgi:hypothetical protein